MHFQGVIADTHLCMCACTYLNVYNDVY